MVFESHVLEYVFGSGSDRQITHGTSTLCYFLASFDLGAGHAQSKIACKRTQFQGVGHRLVAADRRLNIFSVSTSWNLQNIDIMELLIFDCLLNFFFAFS